MGKFNSAKMLGASDVAFQNRYNELIDLLDTGLSFERTVDGKRLRVVLNNQEGLSFYEGATRRGGLAVINNELSLITDVLTSAINMSAFLKFDTLDYSSGTSSRLGFFVPDMITPSTTPIKTMDLFGAYIQGGSSVKIIDTGIRASSDDLDEIVLFRIRTDSDTTMTETLHSTENSWHVIQNSLTWGGVNSVSYTLGRTGFDIGSMGTKWLEVKSGETKVFGTAKATGLVIEGGIANGIFGYTGLSWMGSTDYPTLMSSASDRWVMHLHPHIVYTQNGQRGYAGITYGANIRFEKDTSTGGYWDVGVLSDRFRISRLGTEFFSIDTAGQTNTGLFQAWGKARFSASTNSVHLPTLGSIADASAFFSNSNLYFGLAIGTSNTGVSWIQAQRSDGGADAYAIDINPSGGAVRVNGSDVLVVGNYNVFQHRGWSDINANTMPFMEAGFTYAQNAPWVGPIAHFGAHNYSMQLNSHYVAGNQLSFRTRNGDSGIWNPWYNVWSTATANFATGAGTSNETGGADTNVSFGKTFASPPTVCANSINGSYTCRIKSVSTTGFVLVISGGSVTFNYIAVLV